MPSVLDIGRRTRWAPGPSAKINWSHPLAQGLQSLALPGNAGVYDFGPLGVALSTLASTTGVPGPVIPQPAGNAAQKVSGADWHMQSVVAPSQAPNRTYETVCSPTSLGAVRVALGHYEVSANAWIGHDASGLPTFSANGSTAAGAALTSGAQVHIVGVIAGTSMTLYVNGAQAGTATAGTANQPNAVLQLGFFNTPTFFFFQGAIAKWSLYNRALSATEVAALYADPFQMLNDQPLRKYVLFGALSASGPSLLPIRRRQTLISTKG